jgi:hypothetical protein
MQLQRISIDLCQYGPESGRYTGKAYFAGQYGGVDVTLSPELSARVLEACGDMIVDNAKRVAALITAEVIVQAPALADRSSSE